MKYLHTTLMRYVERLESDFKLTNSALEDVIERFSNEDFKTFPTEELKNCKKTVKRAIEDIQDLKKLSVDTLDEIEDSLKDLYEIIQEER